MKITKNFYEKVAWKRGKYVCGIDEVGRGCLAGPLVTCACILPQKTKYALLKDSKIMSQSEREKSYLWIVKNCFFSIAIFDNKKIDSINIYQTTKISMQKSLLQILNIIPFDKTKLKFILTDAMPIKIPGNINAEHYHFSKGETYSTSIAAASIIAKVFRDRLMQKLERSFPKFRFSNNKGYGTIDHVNTIKILNRTIIHRKSFLNKIIIPKKKRIKQTSLFLKRGKYGSKK